MPTHTCGEVPGVDPEETVSEGFAEPQRFCDEATKATLSARRTAVLSQRPKVEHDLPSLGVGKKTERGHACTGVAAANLPEQRTVALRLHIGRKQIRPPVGATRIGVVARRATLSENL